jgi:hypothetical protein
MNLRTPVMLALALAAVAVLGGCYDPCPKEMVTLDQVVGEYNANAAKVPRLWARAKIKVDLVSKDGLPFSWGSTMGLASPNGLVVLQKHPKFPLGPYYFLMRGKEVSEEIFRVGSHVDEEDPGRGKYYFVFGTGQKKKIWIGNNALAGAPGAGVVPIDPHQLLTVLGICELPADFTRAPTVVRTLDIDPSNCAYVLSYLGRQPTTGRLGVRREVYFHWGPDREPLQGIAFKPHARPEEKLTKWQRRPFMVKFLDADGRRIMTAYLQDYQPIEPPDEDDEDPLAAAAAKLAARAPAEMPTDIRIEWPEKKTNIHVRLSEMTSKRKGNIPVATQPPREEGATVYRVDEHIPMGRLPK